MIKKCIESYLDSVECLSSGRFAAPFAYGRVLVGPGIPPPSAIYEITVIKATNDLFYTILSNINDDI